jgi:8-oxo-dGTP diphosphatase
MSWQDKHKVVPAVYVVLRRDDQVLLIRRANTGYHDGEYSFPAGHVDGGEPAKEAAAREAKEEAGIDIAVDDLHFVHVMHRVAEEGNHERVDFYFTATKWQGEPHNVEPEKCDDVRWFKLDELPASIAPLTKQVLAEIKAGSYYSHANF